MNYPTFALATRHRTGHRLPPVKKFHPIELPRVSKTKVGERDVFVLSNSRRSVAAYATPGLRQALSGIQMGQQTISDSGTAASILNTISTMNQQIASAQSVASSNATISAQIQPQIDSWNAYNSQYAGDINAISTAAENVQSGMGPQTVTDQQMSELNYLAQTASTIATNANSVQSGGAVTPTTTPTGTAITGGAGASATVSLPGLPGMTTPGTGLPGVAPSFISPTGMILGLPWWEWLLFGVGGYILITALSSKGGMRR